VVAWAPPQSGTLVDVNDEPSESWRQAPAGSDAAPDGSTVSRLVVLGSCAAWPEPGRACSGYLLEHAGFRVVMDLGYGTLPRLLETLGSAGADGLDAVVVTHRHPDHMVDLHGLYRARAFARPSAPSLPLFSPPGVIERLQGLEEDDGSGVPEVFDWRPLPGPTLPLGPFRLESVEVSHSVPTVGVRLVTDGLVVAYTGDTGPVGELASLGRDADLLVIEATEQHQQEPSTSQESPTHLTGRQAGDVAAAAGARRVLLTHFWPGNDRDVTLLAARTAYDGELLSATEGQQVLLP
jgi:ribonuclease BN (tRNA processing enzyme)